MVHQKIVSIGGGISVTGQQVIGEGNGGLRPQTDGAPIVLDAGGHLPLLAQQAGQSGMRVGVVGGQFQRTCGQLGGPGELAKAIAHRGQVHVRVDVARIELDGPDQLLSPPRAGSAHKG